MKIKILLIILFFFNLNGLLSQTRQIDFDFNVIIGKPKNLLGVNVGPGSSIKGYRECGISEIRTHDFYGPFDYWEYTKNALDTGEQVIKSTFNPEISSSYNWKNTDSRMDSIVRNGFIPFYRLGISYPHSPAVPIFPPIDDNNKTFSKFAQICKRTVLHYNYGWDNGFYHSIKYWEVWNEPDYNEKFWLGKNATPLNYFKMYQSVADTLKKNDKEIKIGGPGLAYYSMIFSKKPYREDFVKYCKDNNVPLDFYSFHLYDIKNPFAIKAYGDTIRKILNDYDFNKAEIFITEIHPNLKGTEYTNTIKGACWTISAFITCNYSQIDKFFWYRGTKLGPLVDDDQENEARLLWNGVAYKAYFEFYRSVNFLVKTDGILETKRDFDKDVNNLTALAGSSETKDTVMLLISNLNSNYLHLSLKLHNTKFKNGYVLVQQYRIGAPNDRLSIKMDTIEVSNGELIVDIMNAKSPVAYLMRIFNIEIEVNAIKNKPVKDINFNFNQFTNIATIETDNKFSEIKIMDIFGRTLKTIETKYSYSKYITIDLNNLIPGIYFINFKDHLYKICKY